MPTQTDAVPAVSQPDTHTPSHATSASPSPRPPWLRTLIRHDLPASFVIFLIAIPLSLGVASAAGAPLMAGLIAAVVGGIVAGILGGAPLQVSGPSASVTLVVAQLVHSYGWAATTAITVAAGIVQIGLGLSKLGRGALSLSPAIVHGMLAGIGITIALGELHVVLGGTPQESVIANLRELPQQVMHHHGPAVAVGAVTIGVLLIWPRIPKLKVIPAALIAVAGATALASTAHWSLARVSLPDNPLSALHFPTLPAIDSWSGANTILVAVFTIAAITSMESLLSAVAVDKTHNGPRANLNRELIAQGTANVISGGLGGAPVTGVIVRSATNVAAGARTRASAILHGIWVAALVLVAAGLLELIPMAALAAVLVVVGVRLVDLKQIRNLARHHELTIFLVTLLGVLMSTIVEGVLAGIAVALIRALYRAVHATIETEQEGPGRLRIVIRGSLIFWAVGRLLRELRAIPAGQRVVIELHADFLDHATYDALADWRATYERMNPTGQVEIEETHGNWYQRAIDGNPRRRRTMLTHSPRWFAPWSSWQTHENAVHTDAMFIGMEEFAQRGARLVRPYLAHLAESQDPEQLFITCADSRIVPNIITSSGPGDLFCVRNIANLVPRYRSSGSESLGAAIEFATEVLNIRSIAVCGHSNCGGMRATLDGKAGQRTQVGRWLRHAKPSLARLRSGEIPAPLASLAEQEQLCIINVLQQLENLASYPTVQKALAAGELTLVGLYFDIRGTRLYRIGAETHSLEPIGNDTQYVVGDSKELSA